MSNRQYGRKLDHAESTIAQARAVVEKAAEAAAASRPQDRTPDEQLALDLVRAAATILDSYNGDNQ